MENIEILQNKEELLLMDSNKVIELMLRIYLGRDDTGPLYWYVFNESTIHTVHGTKWITVTAEELREYFLGLRH